MFKQPQDTPTESRMLRIASLAGTRPEAIKLAPLVLEAGKRPTIKHSLIATGQQDELFESALGFFGLRVDHQIDVKWRSVDRETLRCTVAANLIRGRPGLVLVQGDTDSALVGAQVAHSLGVPVGHLEAGLRSFDFSNPFPEEQNRVAIARLATLHFAPNAVAAANLQREGVRGHIYVTGNTGIDALMMQEACRRPVSPDGPILVTCHRRENFGAPLERICAAIASLADRGLQFTIPLHSNPNTSLAMRKFLSGRTDINLVEPLCYPDLIEAIRRSPFTLSDSGGLQEECAALGTPLLLLRENTERPEVVENGNCVLVGSDSDTIVERSLSLAADAKARQAMARPFFPYGRGDAAIRILKAIEAWYAGQTGPNSDRIGQSFFCREPQANA